MFYAIWKKWPFLFKFRFILGLILVIIIGLFLYLKVLPFGSISYSRDYTSSWQLGKGFINNFTPAERIDIKNGEGAVLLGDPVYFSLFTPRTFDKAKITIIYKDNLSIDTPLIEAGVLADNVVWRYNLRPIDNKALDYLMLRWNKITESGKLLLQKENKYTNISDFEKDLNVNNLNSCVGHLNECLVVYNYDFDYKYRIPNYQPAMPLVVDQPLRGAHQFYVYLNNETLNLEFNLVDLNLSPKAAPINIVVYSGSEIIASENLVDENLNPASGKTEEKKIVINKKNLPAGVYKVDVRVSDDIVIKKIISSLDHLAFINKVWPVSNDRNLKIYTDSNHLQVKALNPASLQTIVYAGDPFLLNETYKQFDFKTDSALNAKEIDLNKADVILENDGVFSFAQDSLFNPGLEKASSYFSVKTDAKYIIANYEKPIEQEGFKTATVELNLKGAYRENGKYSFMISVPGLKADDGIKDNLEIYKIKIELEGRTLWQKIWE